MKNDFFFQLFESKLVYKIKEFADVPSSKPKSKEEKDYLSLLKKTHELRAELYSPKNFNEALEFMKKNELISKKAYQTAKLYLDRRKVGRNVSIRGDAFDTDFEIGMQDYFKVLTKWCDFVTTQTGDYTNKFYKKVLLASNKLVIKKVKPERKKFEESIDRALKMQAYFGAPGVEKAGYRGPRAIRMKLLFELDKEYPGFLQGYEHPRSKWLKVGPRDLIEHLNNRLYDLFQVLNYNEGAMESFMADMPALVDNELDLDAIFNDMEFQEIYKELKKKFKEYLSHFKVGAKGKKSQKRQGRNLLNPEELDKLVYSKETSLYFKKAKSQLRKHGFTFDDDTYQIFDEQGYEIFSAKDELAYLGSIEEISAIIKRLTKKYGDSDGMDYFYEILEAKERGESTAVLKKYLEENVNGETTVIQKYIEKM